MIRAFVILLFCLPVHSAWAQVQNVIYVELSDQSNRPAIVNKVDSLIAQAEAPSMVMVSNGSTPILMFTNTPKESYQRKIRVSNPSSPSPFFDVDTLFKSIAVNGGLSRDANVYFFLGEYNAGGRQKQGESLFEQFLLVGQLVENGRVASKGEAVLYLNPQIELSKTGEATDLKGNFRSIIKGVKQRTL